MAAVVREVAVVEVDPLRHRVRPVRLLPLPHPVEAVGADRLPHPAVIPAVRWAHPAVAVEAKVERRGVGIVDPTRRLRFVEAGARAERRVVAIVDLPRWRLRFVKAAAESIGRVGINTVVATEAARAATSSFAAAVAAIVAGDPVGGTAGARVPCITSTTDITTAIVSGCGVVRS